MFKDGWAPLNPGFAMNSKLAENIAISKGTAVEGDPLEVSIPLSTIPESGRAPLIAPNTSFSYTFDSGDIAKFNKGAAKDLLSAGKLPILFVDGHVESMTPKEYSDKKLYLYPEAQDN
jgi:prepilin-type processing-associated H-X9-DG protein